MWTDMGKIILVGVTFRCERAKYGSGQTYLQRTGFRVVLLILATVYRETSWDTDVKTCRASKIAFIYNLLQTMFTENSEVQFRSLNESHSYGTSINNTFRCYEYLTRYVYKRRSPD
jgi:hypothetical protein